MEEKRPDRLYIDKKDEKLYKELEKEIFKNKTNKEQFLFAMAIGFKNDLRRPLDKRVGYVRSEYLRPEDESIINAVAISAKGSIDILANKEEVFKIVEEYAHAGIRILHTKISSLQYGTFYKQLERELFEMYEKLDIGENDEETIFTG